MKEKRCWMCKRTKKEIAEQILENEEIFDGQKRNTIDCYLEDKDICKIHDGKLADGVLDYVFVCEVCKAIIRDTIFETDVTSIGAVEEHLNGMNIKLVIGRD